MARQSFKVNRNIINRRSLAATTSQPHSHFADLIGNAPEIIACGSSLACPANSSPLQRMIRHTAAFLIAARAPHIPCLFTAVEDNQRRQWLAFKFGDQESAKLG